MNLDEVREHMARRDLSLLLTSEARWQAYLTLADDVPDLVAEVTRLNQQVDELKRLISRVDAYFMEPEIQGHLLIVPSKLAMEVRGIAEPLACGVEMNEGGNCPGKIPCDRHKRPDPCPKDVCPHCYHRVDDPAHRPCMSSDNRK